MEIFFLLFFSCFVSFALALLKSPKHQHQARLVLGFETKKKAADESEPRCCVHFLVVFTIEKKEFFISLGNFFASKQLQVDGRRRRCARRKKSCNFLRSCVTLRNGIERSLILALTIPIVVKRGKNKRCNDFNEPLCMENGSLLWELVSSWAYRNRGWFDGTS